MIKPVSREQQTWIVPRPLPHEPNEGDEVDSAGPATTAAPVLGFFFTGVLSRPARLLPVGIEFVQRIQDVVARGLKSCIREIRGEDDMILGFARLLPVEE